MLTTRDARPEDLPAVARAVAAQPLMSRYGNSAEALERTFTSALARGEDFLVAQAGEALTGMAWFLRSGTFALGGYLRLIAVYPGCEGQGIGAALLDEVERRTAAASRHLFLLVSHHNDGARRFYARRGYVEAGALPALVRPDIDEVILWKRLR